MTYWWLHYHLIWATFERQPTITLEREKVLYGVLYGKGKELDLKIHAAGNVDDHVHNVSIPIQTLGTLFGTQLYIKNVEICYRVGETTNPGVINDIFGTGVYKTRDDGGSAEIYWSSRLPRPAAGATIYPGGRLTAAGAPAAERGIA